MPRSRSAATARSAARSSSAVRYAFDEAGRLVVTERRAAARRARALRIVEGTLSTDRANRLVYSVRTEQDPQAAARQTFAFDGTWRLTPNHALALALHGTDGQPRQNLFLRGSIVEAKADALVFALRRGGSGESGGPQRLSLSGRWRADDRNRLTFLVEKADGAEDRLTLQGGWEIGSHHELVYRYRNMVAPGGRPDERTVAFEGAWDVTRADRLIYRLAGSSASAFEFTARLQSPSLQARDGRIVYAVGVRLAQGQLQRRRVTLFGTWKLHRDLSVSFEIPYAGGRVEAIRFTGTFAPSPRDRIAVALSRSRREPLGLTVTFTRELVPDASLFLRLHKDSRERSVIGGVHVKF